MKVLKIINFIAHVMRIMLLHHIIFTVHIILSSALEILPFIHHVFR